MLCVDIGNSRTSFALFGETGILARTEIATARLEPDAIHDAFHRLSGKVTPESGEPVAVASVVPDATERMLQGLAALGAQPALVIDPQVHAILPLNGVGTQTVGVDRLLSARAARDLHDANQPGQGLIVIQAGSAVTIDYVGPDGAFEGGVILPGPALWLRGLATAARLPDLVPEDTDWQAPEIDPIGKNTEAALRHGLALGLVGAVQHVETTIRSRLESDPLTVLTGGWAGHLVPHLAMRCHHTPDLVLQGLYRVANEIAR